ncbi:MAG: VWA domain-containing protein [Planctomycetota bacterium]|nr:VWA domain-containing protein [Planctomycetota bacterium]
MPWFLPGFLTPAFFVLGLVAISLPVLFHFIRRTPRGNVLFSTLMFLHPSPPRLTKRSRVDNWLLMILRGLVLLFVAMAFGRIFFRQTDLLSISDLPIRRVAILVDNSASMFRGDLWSQAQQELETIIDELGPNDEAAVFAFNSELNTVVGFSSDHDSVSARRELIRNSLQSTRPQWRKTDLGGALVEAVEKLERDFESASKDQIAESQIVVITDFQAGATLKALQSFEWPAEIRVDLKTLAPTAPNNATLNLLANTPGIATHSNLRVKVSNISGSDVSQFDLNWLDDQGVPADLAGTVVVPPGQSRVINLKPPARPFTGLELRGDDQDFDNRFYLAYPKQLPEKIVFVGNDDRIKNQLSFYLKKACEPLTGTRFVFSDESSFYPAQQGGIVFVVGKLTEDQIQLAKRHNEQGGLVCIVVTDTAMQQTVSELIGSPVLLAATPDVDYALISEIDFSHKIFEPFADPKFSNFSNIRFWKHRTIESQKLTTLARFDTGAAAISVCPVGKGQCFLFASGWHPADSQFALSTKFVGVMMSMMLKSLSPENLNLSLDEPVDLNAFLQGPNLELTTPEKNTFLLPDAPAPRILPEINKPGIYQLSSGKQTKPLAFNLPPMESLTHLMDQELLEQEQVSLGTMIPVTEKIERERQRRDTELESRQKLWRWMLILALGTLFLETYLAGRFARQQTQTDLVPQES